MNNPSLFKLPYFRFLDEKKKNAYIIIGKPQRKTKFQTLPLVKAFAVTLKYPERTI